MIWVDILAWGFLLMGISAWILVFIKDLKEKERMTKKKNDAANQYATLVLNNHIDDVVKFQECMLNGVLETRDGWNNEEEFMTMKRFNEDILTVLKSVQSSSEEVDDGDDNIEYMPLGFRTDDVN